MGVVYEQAVRCILVDLGVIAAHDNTTVNITFPSKSWTAGLDHDGQVSRYQFFLSV